MSFNISLKERDMILKIAEGNPASLQTLMIFCKFSHREEILRRLISNGLVGKKFTEWFFLENRGSFVSCARLLMNMKSNAPVYFDSI